MTPELLAELEAQAKDAARYRYLRTHYYRKLRHRLEWWLPYNVPLTADGLDEAIDNAIADDRRFTSSHTWHLPSPAPSAHHDEKGNPTTKDPHPGCHAGDW